jgi:hydrogenase-4 component A
MSTEKPQDNQEQITLQEDPPEKVSRRDFLKQASAGTLALVAVGAGFNGIVKSKPAEPIPESDGFILPDPTLCIGCLTCEVICSRVHEEQGLSSLPRIRIFNDPKTVVNPTIRENFGDRGQFHQSPCLMCPDAPCHYVCPADALVIEPITGARYVFENNCIACGRCAEACPFPTLPESDAVNGETHNQHTRLTYDPDKNVYTKCDLCFWRDGGPACVERCPVNIRINQGMIKSDHLCLDKPPATPANWDKQSQKDWGWNI